MCLWLPSNFNKNTGKLIKPAFENMIYQTIAALSMLAIANGNLFTTNEEHQVSYIHSNMHQYAKSAQ